MKCPPRWVSDRIKFRIQGFPKGVQGAILCIHFMPEFTDIDREDFRNLLLEIGKSRMPFGKFGIKAYPPAGVPIMDLPEEYLAWFKQRGFPKGRLGELMAEVFEIKAVGMDSLFDPLRQPQGGRFRLQPTRRKSIDFE